MRSARGPVANDALVRRSHIGDDPQLVARRDGRAESAVPRRRGHRAVAAQTTLCLTLTGLGAYGSDGQRLSSATRDSLTLPPWIRRCSLAADGACRPCRTARQLERQRSLVSAGGATSGQVYLAIRTSDASVPQLGLGGRSCHLPVTERETLLRQRHGPRKGWSEFDGMDVAPRSKRRCFSDYLYSSKP